MRAVDTNLLVRLLVRDDAELLDVIKSGQLVMTSLLSLDGVQAEIDAAVRDLNSGAAKTAAAPPAAQAATGS